MNRELFRLDEISIRGLCLELLRSLWMILVIGVSLWLGITGVHTLIYEPVYTSTATLVVTVKGQTSAYSSLSVTSQMADVFGEVFQSSALRSRIIEDVGEEITGDITCTPITDTNLLTLSVSSPDPRQAYLFINSALENYEQVAGDVFSNASLQILQEPQVPSSPSNTSLYHGQAESAGGSRNAGNGGSDLSFLSPPVYSEKSFFRFQASGWNGPGDHSL